MIRCDNRCVCDKCGQHYSCDSGVPHECPTADVEETEATMQADKLAEATLVNARQDKDLELHGRLIDDMAKRIVSLEDGGRSRSAGGATVPNEYRVTKDGDSWCASGPGFENLVESPSAFGDTPLEALERLFRQRSDADRDVVWERQMEEGEQRAQDAEAMVVKLARRLESAEARISELEALKTPRLQCLRDEIGSMEEKHDAEGAAKIALQILTNWREEALQRGEENARLERELRQQKSDDVNRWRLHGEGCHEQNLRLERTLSTVDTLEKRAEKLQQENEELHKRIADVIAGIPNIVLHHLATTATAEPAEMSVGFGELRLALVETTDASESDRLHKAGQPELLRIATVRARQLNSALNYSESLEKKLQAREERIQQMDGILKADRIAAKLTREALERELVDAENERDELLEARKAKQRVGGNSPTNMAEVECLVEDLQASKRLALDLESRLASAEKERDEARSAAWPPKPDEPQGGLGYCAAELNAKVRFPGQWYPSWSFLCDRCAPKKASATPPDTSLEWRKAHPCPHEAEVRANGCARGPEAGCYCHNSPARYTPEELHGEKAAPVCEGPEVWEKKELLEASIRDVGNVLDWMPMEDVRRNVLYDALGVLRQLE